MAVRFAIASGNWSNTAIWDNGALPLAGDDVYANGFTVTIDQNITVLSLRNDINPVYLPDMSIPLMTSNTSPSGIASASSVSGSNFAYLAFDQNFGTSWFSLTSNAAWLQYQFPVAKTIRRYAFRTAASSANRNPRTWTFEGSNDGTTWTVLDTQTNLTLSLTTWYQYPIASPASYLYYRLNITAVNIAGSGPELAELNMTESTGTVYGSTAGGGFIINNGITVTTVSLTQGSGNLLTYTGNGSCAVTCTNASVTSSYMLVHNGTGTLTYTGTLGLLGGVGLPFYVGVLGGGTLNVIGDLIGVTRGNNSGRDIINVATAAGATINVTGNLIGGTNTGAFSGTGRGIVSSVSCTINVTGNLTGGNYNSHSNSLALIETTAIITVTINGNVTAGSGGPAFGISNNSVVTINGNLFATVSSPALIVSVTGATITINGSLTNASNGIMAYQGYKLFTSTTAARAWNFTKSDATARPLLDASQIIVGGSYPAVGDVRNGLSYGAGLYTGTCVLPAANTVALGTLIDVSTTGTAVLPATVSTQLWNTLVSSLVTSGSIGERLKNCATVDMTGYQIAALL